MAVKVATPEPFKALTLLPPLVPAGATPLSRKVTVPPVVTGLPPLVTVAVKVTKLPVSAGLLLGATVVVVDTPVFSDRVMHQPLLRVVAPGLTEYNAHLPFAEAPSKASPKVNTFVCV